MAIGAMRALMELDIFKPVCGFGGVRLMSYAGKQMNTVRQDFENLAREAAEIVRKALRGKISPEVPASVLQLHPFTEVILDPAAAAML